MSAELLGELAYIAFCSSVQFKTPAGERQPDWADLPPARREAWCDAARAIWSRIMGTELAPVKLLLEDSATAECPHCGFIWPPGYDFERCPGCQQAYDGG